MRILIVSQYFPPDITAAAFRIYDIAKLLSQKNHEVRVVTSYPHKAQAKGQKADAPDPDPITVCRSNTSKIGSGGMINYLKHYCSFMFGSIWIGLKQHLHGWKPNIILASSPPLFVGLSGCCLSKIFRCPMVLDIRDIWPDTAVAAQQISADGYAYRLGRKLELYIYGKAKHIICVSKPMQAYINSQTDTPTTVIYNGVSDAQIQLENDPIQRKKTSNTKRTILYAGNIGHLQELELFVRGFSELCQKGQVANWNLHVTGTGAKVENLKKTVDELKADNNIFIIPPLSRQEAFRKMLNADLLYLNLKQHPILARTIPSKVFDYLLAARPIVAGLTGEGRDILETTGANICFEPGNIHALKGAIIQAIQQLEQLETCSHKNRELVVENFTREKSVGILVNVFNKVMSETNANQKRQI